MADNLPSEIDLTLGREFSTDFHDKFESVRRYINFVKDGGEFWEFNNTRFRSLTLEAIYGDFTPHPWTETIFQKDIWKAEEDQNQWLSTYKKFFGSLPALAPGEMAVEEIYHYELYDGNNCEYCDRHIDLLRKSKYHGMCNFCSEAEDYRRVGFFAEAVSEFPLE
jgi:hypothetical protein